METWPSSYASAPAGTPLVVTGQNLEKLPDDCVLIRRGASKDTTADATIADLYEKTPTSATFATRTEQQRTHDWNIIATPLNPPREVIVQG